VKAHVHTGPSFGGGPGTKVELPEAPPVEPEIRVGQHWRCEDSSVDEVLSVSALAITTREVAAAPHFALSTHVLEWSPEGFLAAHHELVSDVIPEETPDPAVAAIAAYRKAVRELREAQAALLAADARVDRAQEEVDIQRATLLITIGEDA
jgi:hypothetical protein